MVWPEKNRKQIRGRSLCCDGLCGSARWSVGGGDSGQTGATSPLQEPPDGISPDECHLMESHLMESHLMESPLMECHLMESHLMESHLMECHLMESHLMNVT